MLQYTSISSRRSPKTKVSIAQRDSDFGDDVAASIRRNVAFNLRRLIETSGLKQKDVAERIGYSESRVSNWINAKNFPEETAFDALREKFGWTFDQLVRDPNSYSVEDVVKIVTALAAQVGLQVKPTKN